MPTARLVLIVGTVVACGFGLAPAVGRQPGAGHKARPVVLGTEKEGLIHVSAPQLSPDGSVAVMYGCKPDALAREVVLAVWDTATGRLRHKSLGGYYAGVGADFAPDGRTFAFPAMDDGVVLVHDVATGREVRRHEHPRVRFAVHSPDGKHILSGSNRDGEKVLREVRIWDAATGNRLVRLAPTETETLTFVGFARGGRAVFDTQHGTARVVDLATGQERNPLPVGKGAVMSVAPDSTSLLALLDGRPRLIDLATGATVRVFGDPDTRYETAGRSPDGTRVLGEKGGEVDALRVTVWDAATGESRLTFRGSCLAVDSENLGRGPFTPDGRFLHAAWGEGTDALGNTLLWAAVYGPDGRLLRKESGVKYLRFDRAGRRVLVVAGSDPIIDNTPADVVTIHDAATWLAGGAKKD
jgi:WD40 repeat protein